MLHILLEQRLREALRAEFPEVEHGNVKVRPCPDFKFGDYQCVALMGLARERRQNPREFAGAVAGRLKVGELCSSVEVAGPGFLNFRLRDSAVVGAVKAALEGGVFFFAKAPAPRRIVVDFSSPNVAKPMHVGHIRSTILGDCLCRTLRLLGHDVIADNHIGDWGTQFGKLIVGWKERLDAAALNADPLGEMERLYKEVNAACEQDPLVLERARAELVRLQNGAPENLAIWNQMIASSRREFDATYARLGVKFDYYLGESFYNPQLKDVVRQFLDLGIARESEGATVVFFDHIPEIKNHPAIIQKSDGAANYTTTDLATLAYRMQTWQPAEIIYVTDGRQQLHFRQLFAAFRLWMPSSRVKLAHVWFGAILGDDGRPFQTRSGDTIKLEDLLDEAEQRALAVVTEKNPDLSEDERREIARIVGIGALKYSDLLPNRQGDYVFNWDRMLALNGNTAPYLQYAYTRVRSIFRKLGAADSGESDGWRRHALSELSLSTTEEMRLAKHLLIFGLVLEAVADEYRPNYLCNYLYELAGHFTAFYENCPVLKALEPERSSRLALCELTGEVLKLGLNALGLETSEKM